MVVSMKNKPTALDDILLLDDPVLRQEKLVEAVRKAHENNQRLHQELQTANDARREAETLLKSNPDTNLPIYRELVKKVETVTDLANPFWIAQIRLDASYQRIKNSRDRSKVLLFITTLRIKKLLGDVVYQSDRLDEFFVLLENDSNTRDISKILINLEKQIELPHEGPAGDISFGAFMSFARFPEHGSKPTELLENLNTALVHGVQARKRICSYSQEIGDAYYRNTRMETDLHASIQNGFEGFYLVYQPFVNKDRVIRGSESLIRWKHPEFGMIPPPQFIPIAEKNGDIRIFGRWILYKSCLALKHWQTMGFEDMFVSVNLSPVQFGQRDMVENIKDILSATGIDGKYLKLEITEGAVMSDPNDAVEKMHELKKMGIRLSIDDFGTGYSSLNYLRKLPIDTLKIDKSFIDDITSNQQNQEIVRAILAMARSLNIETLAEGVETAAQRDFLMKEGCEYIQGYYYSKPVTEDVFSEYLEAGGTLAGKDLEA